MSATGKKAFLFSVTLALIGGTAFALVYIQANRRLGNPGVKAVAEPGRLTMQIELPAQVLDFTSSNVPTAQTVLDYLPKDTSYAQRHYTAPDGMWVMANLILMGADRTSIHRPDYCLPGQGWQIVQKTGVKIPVVGDRPYELPVQKWVLHNAYTTAEGQRQEVSGLYVFWFVAENHLTDDYETMVTSSAFHLLRHGVLERWTYASYFTYCPPGLEDATFARIKNMIAVSVPEFQLPPAK